jgi:tetratricopeptide (TPR) repeat protein
MRAGNAKGAVTELQDAIRLAPGNAQAHSTLAHALNTLAYTDTSSTRRAIGQSPSVAAAERGAALDPSCGPCHGTLGFFLFYHDWQWTRAETHLREAIRLSPDEESIRPSYAMLLSATGRQAEALAEIDLALQKQPYQAGWRVIRTSILYLSRRYADAVAAADETLLIARQRGAWEWRSKALFQLDRGAEAVNAMAQDVFAAHSADLDRAVREDGPEAGLRTLLSLTDDWRGRVEHSWRRGPWRAILGDTDGALEEVERAYEARRLNAIYLGVDPVYDRIRSHPRFQKVLTDMGLTAVLR